MNFIEQWLHVTPDGGSGLLEFGLLAGLCLAAAILNVVRALYASPMPADHRYEFSDRD